MKYARIILVIFVLSIVLLEIALRILADFQIDSALFINDSDIGYRMRPNVSIRNGLTTNSLGFNDNEHSMGRREGSIRMAIIGDSFVFGAVPRKENFTHILQELADKSSLDLEVLNMGIPAAEPNNYLALLKKDAVLMNADEVCVVFFVGNDIIQAHPDFKTSVWLGSTRETLRRPYLIGFSKEYSYVYRTARSLTGLIRERIDKTPRESFTKANYLAIEYRRSGIYKINKSKYIKESYTGAISILKKIANEADLLNKNIFFVFAPDELQVNDKLRTSLLNEYNLSPNDYDFSAPQRIIVNELKQSGKKAIDLLPAFREAAQKDSLYIKQDSHWNKAGNLLAAKSIMSYIMKQYTVAKTDQPK
ncbi:MAG: hypothetical protein WBN48_17320 [Thiogranum sp.]